MRILAINFGGLGDVGFEEAHRERIKTKLNLKNASELNCQAVQWVLRNG